MALVIADRVRETTTTTGTGTITLAGPYTGFQAFSVIGNGNTTYYAIIDASTGAWEVGIGAYTSSGNTLSRDTILSSSNSGSAVNFGAGTKDVIITQPSARAVFAQSGGSGLQAGVAAVTANGVPYAASTSTLATGSGLTFDGTTLSASNISTAGSTTLSGGTANGVAYLNGSKVLTTGSSLTFDGTTFGNTYAGAPSGTTELLKLSRQNSGIFIKIVRDAGSGNAGGLIGADSVGTYYAGSTTANMLYIDTANTNLQFYANGYEQMRLTSTSLWTASGINVGIGTSSPAAKLHVVGGTAASLTAPAILVQNNRFLTFQNAAGSSWAAGMYADSSDNFAMASYGYMAFFTGSGPTERARIDSSGTFRVKGAGTAGSTDAFQVSGSAPADAARIDSSGDLLVGTTSSLSGSSHSFKAIGTTAANYAGVFRQDATGSNGRVFAWQLPNTSDSASYFVYATNSGGNCLNIFGNGNITNSNNSYGAISDAKLKENVTDATPKLEKLNQVRVVNYNLIGGEQKQIGVIAQELEQIFPSMVEETADKDVDGNDLGTTTKSVKYSVFVPMLIKAMQEQQAIIEALTARIAALESK